MGEVDQQREVTPTELGMLETLVRWGPQSRREIARRLDLTATRMSQVTAELVKRGFVVEAQASRPSVGRPARLIDIVPDEAHFMGIHIGRSTVTSCVTNLRAEVVDTRVDSLEDPTPAAALMTIMRHHAALDVTGRDLRNVGVCLEGQVDARGTVVRAPFLGWKNVPLGPMIEAALPARVRLDNDLVGLTQDEHWFGAGRNTTQFATVTIGEGVGLGLVVNDRRVSSRDDGLGLISHLPVSSSGQLCPQGHRGCARAMLSTQSLKAALLQAHGAPIEVACAVDLARVGDHPALERILTDAAAALGMLLGYVANIALTRTLVITGENASIAAAFGGVVEAALKQHRHPLADELTILVRDFDSSHWARGAAARAIEAFAFDA